MMLFESIEIAGLLSFGWEAVRLPLGSLNVFIGPNASGKSNLFEVLRLLQAVPRDHHAVIRSGGGPLEWTHKRARAGSDLAHVEVVIADAPEPSLRYRLDLRAAELQMELVGEELATRDALPPSDRPFPFFVAHEDRATVKRFGAGGTEHDGRFGVYRWTEIDPLHRGRSILATLRDPLQYPQLTRVAERLQQIRMYQTTELGPRAAVRRPQPADAPNHVLEADGSNLGLVLSRLRKTQHVRTRLRELLALAYPEAEDVETVIEGGMVQVFLHESELDSATPAARLSDGTLRWLWLLCLLLDPAPPALVCLEEPEIGLHPDLIPALVRLLRDAAERTQILVTTHSELLISELTDVPEDVIVCERLEGSTHLRRLERAPLEHWLANYSLGHAWRAGELGGNRW